MFFMINNFNVGVEAWGVDLVAKVLSFDLWVVLTIT